jgi:SAM-dependent methyltransferase
MKVRDSGMPEERYWESLFDVPLILKRLLPAGRVDGQVAELGCGYGTFTIPVARGTGGLLHAYDVDPAMIERTNARVAEAGLSNVRTVLRDVVAHGFGLPSDSCALCLLFNILHCENPEALLREAARVVGPGGRALVIHWRSDVPTPRGPPLAIRPRLDDVNKWAHGSGLGMGSSVDLPPWHYGTVLAKPV